MKCLSLFCPKTIGRRSVTSGQWWIQGKGLAGPTLIFRPNWGPKDWQNFFFETRPPLISGFGWLLPPPLSEGLDLPLQVIMVAKFLELNNLSWVTILDRDSHLHCQTMKKIHGLPFGSWVESCSYLSFFFFFFWPYQGLLRSNVVMWYNDVSTIVDLLSLIFSVEPHPGDMQSLMGSRRT